MADAKAAGLSLTEIQLLLPPGWTVEEWSGYSVIHASGNFGGLATLDFKKRWWNTGMSWPNRASNLGGVYAGRGWQQQMVGDAVKVLQDVNSSPP